MSHWAEIDKKGLVLRVLVGDNNEPDEGYQWLIDNLGGSWVKTSYNASIRKNFAGIGYTYDKKCDAFIPPQIYASWVLDADTCRWVAPVPCPDDGLNYDWDEDSTSWKLIETEK